MRPTNILLIGGTGFVGRRLVNALADRGGRLLVPTRQREKAKALTVVPTCDVVAADVHDDAALDLLVAGQDAVVNLVGILHGTEAEFERAHVRLTERVLAACERRGVRRYVHMSALGADPAGPSMYQRSKGRAAAAVRASRLAWTIFEPSVIFGPEDRFLNLFAALARFAPVLPIGRAEARFQPVYVGDVAQAWVASLDDEATELRSYELCGPKIYTLRELVRFAAAASGHPRPVVAMPDGIARLQAAVMERLPGRPLLSRDNLDSMQRDNVATRQPYVPAPELGITPTALEPTASVYLAPSRSGSRFVGIRARR